MSCDSGPFVPLPFRCLSQICCLVMQSFPHWEVLLLRPKLGIVALEKKGGMLVTSVTALMKWYNSVSKLKFLYVPFIREKPTSSIDTS